MVEMDSHYWSCHTIKISHSVLGADISSLVFYVASYAIVLVHMTRCALQPVREKEIAECRH